jgi:O-antigen/teichoic acid export membrane protein
MKVLKNSIIYFSSSILEKGIGFFLIPIYTSFLLPKDYGILTLLQSVIAILVILFTFSLNGAASRFHFDGNNLLRKWHYGNIFTTITIISFIISILIFLLKDYIFLLLGSIPIYPYIYFLIILGYTNSVFILYQQKLQMEQRAVYYAIYSMLKLILSSLFAIVLLKYFSMKADGVFLGFSLAGIILLFLIIFNFYREKIKLNLHKKLLKKNLNYSIYLVPHNLASIVIQFMDRIFISNLLNLSQTGIFSLGSQISGLVAVFAAAINNATVPAVLKAYKNKNYQYLVNLLDISIIFIGFIATSISILAPEIISIMAPKSFSTSWKVVPPLTFYFVIQMYYFMTSSVLFYEKKATKFVAVSTIISLILNVVLNYILINFFGIIGASYATLFAMIMVNYIVIYIANKYIFVGFNHLKIHFYIIIMFISANINFLVNLNLVYKLLVVLFVFILLLFKEINNPLIRDTIIKLKAKI